MTIVELISKLQEMDQDMLVLQTRNDHRDNFYYETFDGWWPQYVSVRRTADGIYTEDNDGVEALTI